ncbi:DUF4367 domain-containing protein [Tepidibacillus fermentans]|uniref:Outer membrane lipoprotein-sorting protein n=1 Tax=Tepidibacillus fermentans TaxID=1281767 RepID=A0A4R3K663_9BACI|nr:DUF4367 domain-containing protein [Tepidibacillus fermentans]TCS78354.1 outer membrane lipoprotein-sorting protein [Tepidibacillus fermentans]
MHRSKWLLMTIVIIFMVFLSGCGTKDSNDVVSDLEDQLADLDSYQAVGTMKIQTGETVQEYNVQVWYKQPHFYRIELNNLNTKVTQIVLKNDDGVFVLDPAIKKSFRFKSDWPESSGQPYLFESLVKSVIDDKDRVFAKEEGNYVFQVKANYQNQSLTAQKVWFGKDLQPIRVEIYDPNEVKLVEMVFSKFEFDSKFDDDAFEMNRNLEGWDQTSLPAMKNMDNSKSFGIIEPSYIPTGVEKKDLKVVNQDNERKVVLKYGGEFNYSLIESRPQVRVASAPENSKSDIIDLGYGIGVLTEMTETRSLRWTYDGVEYLLTGDLPTEEMVAIAKSVFAQTGK